MSYSVEQPCGNCKKSIECADGKVILGSVQGIIHSMPTGYSTPPGPHLGSGRIVHECSNFENIIQPEETKAQG